MRHRFLIGLPLLLAACNTPDPGTGPAVPAVPGEVTVARTEWGQSVLKPDLRLVAGKPALLRVHLLGDRDGLPGVLRGEVFRGSTRLGELSFSGPATLPTAVDPAQLAQTYRATVPADWVTAGMEVRLQADPANRIGEGDEAGNRLSLTPAVGAGTVLPLTIVPVIQPGQAAQPTVPGVDLLRDMLPVRDVQAVTRAPFSYGTTVTNSGTVWSNLLSAIRALRTSDGSSRYYYGLVRVGYSSGIAGIGYIGLPASAGWDFSGSAARIMIHELGHNFGELHAPCGATSGLDGSYPYAGGSIGTWGYSLAGQTLFSPAQYKDVMSYCSPQWISDYMYAQMQSALEARPPSAQSQGLAQEVLLVSGVIRGGRVELNPLTKALARPQPPRPGPYRLRLDTAGGLVEVAFAAEAVAAPHGPDQPPAEPWSEEHFSFSLPDPGEVRGLEVTRSGRQLFQRTAESRPQSQSAAYVSLLEQDGKITLSWPGGGYPYASVAHLGSQRTTLGLWLQGGEAALSTEGLEAGGRLEVTLSDGVNSVRQEFAR